MLFKKEKPGFFVEKCSTKKAPGQSIGRMTQSRLQDSTPAVLGETSLGNDTIGTAKDLRRF